MKIATNLINVNINFLLAEVIVKIFTLISVCYFVVFCWVPSNLGVSGNETTDAKKSSA